MSNLHHPNFTGATPTRFELGNPQKPAAASDAPAPRGREANVWSIGLGVASIGLWAFLVAELASKFSPPTVL